MFFTLSNDNKISEIIEVSNYEIALIGCNIWLHGLLHGVTNYTAITL
jgi:hypothetical protein